MTVQPYLLPAGTVNNRTAYFYADSTKQYGPIIKRITDQVLVIIDYTTVLSGTPITGFKFTSDVESNPPLYVTDPITSATGNVLSFLVSGGIQGQQYNITIGLNPVGIPPAVTVLRNDVLTINIPSDDTCCGSIPPMVTLLGSNSLIACCIHFYWGPSPPSAPFVMDEWFDTTANILYEWITDGSSYWWQEIGAGGPGSGPGTGTGALDDAPADGVLYSRRNHLWIPDPIQVDAPGDGKIYVRNNDNWIPDPLQIDAPADGQVWGRQDNEWSVVMGGGGGFPDAPTDGKIYGRQDNDWTAISPSPMGIVFVYPGKPPANQVINVPIFTALQIYMDLANSWTSATIYASTPATANAVFTLYRIGPSILHMVGTVTVTAGSNTACVLFGYSEGFASGDTMQMVAPATQDATLADISITIAVNKLMI